MTQSAWDQSDGTVEANRRRALIARMSDAELTERRSRHTNRQTLRFIDEEAARRANA